MSTRGQKARIVARVPKSVRKTLEQAAELQGATLNQFLIQSAYREAQAILERESVIRLSSTQAKQVFELIDKPPKPNSKLLAALKSYRTKVRA